MQRTRVHAYLAGPARIPMKGQHDAQRAQPARGSPGRGRQAVSFVILVSTPLPWGRRSLMSVGIARLVDT